MAIASVKSGIPFRPPMKLLDQVRDRIRYKHYSIRIEHSYVLWVKRFVLFHGKRHARCRSCSAIRMFLLQ